ncbi:hypothetical protein, unlikely [Trypanosoma congolense IL3000]|uniref:Uncharacterized protein n=1 Tax=Trypanosoma congolense (strain IL3000) TaxID=1068625 RepID=F9WC92_TRYCI|nr:hypothetical protein, unlikely [Trypanosoma congolense IL3000]
MKAKEGEREAKKEMYMKIYFAPRSTTLSASILFLTYYFPRQWWASLPSVFEVIQQGSTRQIGNRRHTHQVLTAPVSMNHLSPESVAYLLTGRGDAKSKEGKNNNNNKETLLIGRHSFLYLPPLSAINEPRQTRYILY